MKKNFCLWSSVFLAVIIFASSACAAMSDEAFVKLCSNGSVQEIQEALQQGANPNASITAGKKGITPLMAAALNNEDPRVFRILLKAGADINAKNEDGWTALTIAATTQNVDVVDILVKAGAKVAAEEFFIATNNENSGVMSVLAKAVENMSTKGKPGWVVIMDKAKLNENPELTTALSQAGASVYLQVHARVGTDATQLMMIAVQNEENLKVVNALIKAGAKLNIYFGDKKQTILMMAAAFNDNSKVINALIKAGANVNAKDNDGRTPLIYAAGRNSNLGITEALLKAKADINVQDNDGWTALMDAAGHNDNPKIVSALLKAGAKTYLKNNEYQTALDIAEEHLRQDTAKLIKAAMRKR